MFAQAVCGLDYFSSDVKAQLYSLVKRTTEPRCGQVGQDKADAAQGGWFATKDTRQAMSDWSTQLSLIHNNIDPGFGVLAVAGKVSSPMMFVFKTTSSGHINREPSEVKADGSVYCYQNEPQPQNSYVQGNGSGKILIELDNNKLLKVEYLSGKCSNSETLASSTSYYR